MTSIHEQKSRNKLSSGCRNCIQGIKCTYANLRFNLHNNKYLYSFEEEVLLVLYGTISSCLKHKGQLYIVQDSRIHKNVVFLVIYI